MVTHYKLLFILLLVPVLAFGGTFGSHSLIHVQTANTLEQGTLDFRSNMNFYTKVADFLGQNKPANFSSYNMWDMQGNMLLTYGLMNNVDVTLMNRVYQDVNKSGTEYNSPEDIFLDVKVASFGLSNNQFNYGLMTSVRLPSNKVYNYPFEPYTAGAFEYGFTGLFSYYNDPYLHDRSFGLHFNLGWYSHNDAGKTIYDRNGTIIKAEGNATQLNYGLGFVYPTELFNLNLEVSGISYINKPKPEQYIYSRDNYMYMTPSVRFKPKPWMNFDLGLDVRLSSVTDNFQYNYQDLPMYPSWRAYLGISFTLMPIRGKQMPGAKAGVGSRVDFFENLLRERQRSQNIEEELRRLRQEREQAEKELEELRQMLEEQGK